MFDDAGNESDELTTSSVGLDRMSPVSSVGLDQAWDTYQVRQHSHLSPISPISQYKTHFV